MGIIGHSGMGKTTLLEQRLIPALRKRGLVLSLIKHSHKDIDIDRPGKDSYRLREAGCHEVLLLGARRWALVHELRDTPQPTLPDLLRCMHPCDLVLVEGFKDGDFPRIEVWRTALGLAPLARQRNGIVALATDADRVHAASQCPPGLPILDLADGEHIADWAWDHALPV